jgi:2-polyprenyl-3-methyl-5-hydroxy-6-metoxy-1,4-benzoquinol methylase
MSATEVNREYYERMSPGQEDYWRKMAAPRHRVEVMKVTLRELGPASVVDLGCGNGVLLEELRSAMPSATFAGVDLSRPQVAENAKRLPWARFTSGDLQAPLELDADWRGAFEVAVATEVIEHLDRPEAFFANAAALLSPGGRLVLSTQSGPIRQTEQRVGHRRHYDQNEMRALLEKNGFGTERVWNTGFPFHDLSKWYANLDPDGSMRSFGDEPYGLKQNAVCAALRFAFRLNSGSKGAQLFAIARKR